MNRVILAKSAGFCYGVERAVRLAEETADRSGGCYMLGDLIHNTHVVQALEQRGVRAAMMDAVIAACEKNAALGK